MEIAYVTIKNSQHLGRNTEWSGTGYYIASSLEDQGIDISYLGPLAASNLSKVVRKSKRFFYKNFKDQLYIKDTDPLVLKDLSRQVAKKLKHSQAKVILSATVNPIAYLEYDLPIVFWADATFVNTAEFYPEYSSLCHEATENGHLMERLALEKCKFAIYSSDWAAKAAINYYGADPEKVKVINFGANLDNRNSLEETKTLIETRPTDKCKLLFLGKDWFRKGGSTALEVAKTLNSEGLETELTIVGCKPTDLEPTVPEYLKLLGFISKFSKEGKEELTNLIASSHFLILPTIADCSPIVLSEACSLGVPCITTDVGGIPSIIKNNVNGMKFRVDTPISEYCSFIRNIFTHYSDYRNLSLSTFHEYESRLNWSAAAKSLKQLLCEAASVA